MFDPLECIPSEELKSRRERCLDMLRKLQPDAGGMMVFARRNVYWLTGSLANGCVWLPVDGEPVLFLRKSLERARMESDMKNIIPFRSYGNLVDLARDAGAPLTDVIAVEMSGLNWQLGNLLQARLSGIKLISCDMVLNRAQALKSEWELEIMRDCGARHHCGLHEVLPGLIKPGMNEREISHKAWEAFFSIGHQGHMRMSANGEEIFLGHVSSGDSGNYPSHFNGPLGLRGEHPALPFMGSVDKVWNSGEPLACDIGFSLGGYCTDKTQLYWAGPESTIPDEVRSAHRFCMDVQAWVAENARPGALPNDIYRHCLEWAEKDGFAEGFMGLGENKVPFIGHGIGLAIDCWPPIAMGIDAPLEKGMTLAVEPKMGVPGIGMVGVENTFEVRDDCAVCITGDSYEMISIE